VSAIFVLFAFSVLVSSMYTSCMLRNALQFLMIFLYLPIKNNIKKIMGILCPREATYYNGFFFFNFFFFFLHFIKTACLFYWNFKLYRSVIGLYTNNRTCWA
jgi:hypothetical protein